MMPGPTPGQPNPTQTQWIPMLTGFFFVEHRLQFQRLDGWKLESVEDDGMNNVPFFAFDRLFSF